MKKSKFPTSEVLTLLVGELAVAIITLAGYLIYDLFPDTDVTYLHVLLGLALGVLVTTLNYMFMIISVDRAVKNFLELRGSREMTDEEAEKFTAEHQMGVQNAIKTSFIIRTVTMLAALVVAFLVDIFAPIATVIPLLAFRPIVTLAGRFSAKSGEKSPVENPEFKDITENAESPEISESDAPENTAEKECDA